MSRRCKPGMRARVIGTNANRGKVVVVVRYYFGEEVSGFRWPLPLYPWVVTSLGGPLQSRYIDTGKPAPPTMTIVLDDSELEPLRDDDGQDTGDASTSTPSPVPVLCTARGES